MLNPQAKAAAATEELNGRSVSEEVRDGRSWCSVAGTTAHRSRSTHRTGLLVLFEGCREGYSHYQTQVDGLPIWGMSDKRGPVQPVVRPASEFAPGTPAFSMVLWQGQPRH